MSFKTGYCKYDRILSLIWKEKVCPTGRIRGSRPARRSGRSVKKRMNSNIDVL
jgi:hypothetical protein